MRYSSGQLWAITAFASLVYLALGAAGVLSGGNLLDVFWNLSSVIPLLVIGGWIFEQRIWRWNWLHRLRLVSTPVVIGTWQGLMLSDWKQEGSDTPIAPRTVYLTVVQTAVTIKVRLLTDESSSDLLHGLVEIGSSGYPTITYAYLNEPELALQQTRSRMHHGAAMVKIIDDPAAMLEGSYWTDRKTSGTLRFAAHNSRVAQTFEQARALEYGSPRPVGVLEWR